MTNMRTTTPNTSSELVPTNGILNVNNSCSRLRSGKYNSRYMKVIIRAVYKYTITDESHPFFRCTPSVAFSFSKCKIWINKIRMISQNNAAAVNFAINRNFEKANFVIIFKTLIFRIRHIAVHIITWAMIATIHDGNSALKNSILFLFKP